MIKTGGPTPSPESGSRAKVGSGASETLSPTEIHDVLRNDRRRLVLERLRESSDGGEAVSDLAEHIGAVEAGESPPPRNVRQSVYVSLHQTHLPKLDDLEIVAYDSDAKVVELRPRAGDLDPYLDVSPADRRRTAIPYLVVGVVGTAGLLATAAGVPRLRAVGPGVLGLAVSVTVTLVAAYHLAGRPGA